jgi:hypothetical protein
MICCEPSNTVDFKNVLIKPKAMEGSWVLSYGNGSEDHGHPIPRALDMR